MKAVNSTSLSPLTPTPLNHPLKKRLKGPQMIKQPLQPSRPSGESRAQNSYYGCQLPPQHQGIFPVARLRTPRHCIRPGTPGCLCALIPWQLRDEVSTLSPNSTNFRLPRGVVAAKGRALPPSSTPPSPGILWTQLKAEEGTLPCPSWAKGPVRPMPSVWKKIWLRDRQTKVGFLDLSYNSYICAVLSRSVVFNSLLPQAPLSMGISRQAYLGGLPRPPLIVIWFCANFWDSFSEFIMWE